jgi:hypothetical protein
MRFGRLAIATSCGVVIMTPASAFAEGPGTLDITTSDSRGNISVDANQVGVGAFHGDVAPGPHDITVVREGFKRYKKTIVVESGKTASLSVSLEREAAMAPPPPPPDAFGGFYGGFFVGPSLEPGGSNSTFETSCPLIGAVSCSASPPSGFVAAGHVGYTWNPVGIEIFGAFGVDYTSPMATFDGAVVPGSNQALTGPARTESFRVVRVGGMGALRARVTFDGKRVRGYFAAGGGFGGHAMAMDRHAVTTDGSNQTDIFAPPVVTYLAPALSFEVGAALRLTNGLAITAGISTWLEGVDSAATRADPQHYFLPSGTPLRTPSYRLAGAAQFFVWPFVGMQFGP